MGKKVRKYRLAFTFNQLEMLDKIIYDWSEHSPYKETLDKREEDRLEAITYKVQTLLQQLKANQNGNPESD